MVSRTRRSNPAPPDLGRLQVLAILGVLAFVVLLGRAGQLQLVQGERWASVAERQHRALVELPARRGEIRDRNGVALALDIEAYRIGIAPAELADPAGTAMALKRVVGQEVPDLLRLREDGRRWVELPRKATPDQRREIGRIRGVYFERQFERRYPYGSVTREILGVLSADDRSLGGVEQQFDDVLAGVAGRAVYRRAPSGSASRSAVLPVEPSIDGGAVTLTIDLALQEIAREALENAVRSSGARGGDVLIIDPRRGDILAAVSLREGGARSLGAFVEPFEPGSTMKPFAVAALLAEGRATLADSVDAERGVWNAGHRRIIRDVQPHGMLTLHDALRVSSNIALVKFASQLEPSLQYAYLRDFGFGSPTGIDYPSEAGGRLTRPATWSALTPASLAMGYEVSVTPLQLVMAYGALANGGHLLTPRLIREVRAADGRVLAQSTPQPVRRVIDAEVAAALTDALVGAVADGTGRNAALQTFEVAGKTGTARRTTQGEGYSDGRYTATFAGYFPARRPQVAFLVKIDDPQEEMFGGAVAAPVTRNVLHAALAIQANTLDGAELARVRAGRSGSTRAGMGLTAAPWRPPSAPTVFRVRDGAAPVDEAGVGGARRLPDVTGLSLREAVFRLHRLGLNVRIAGDGRIVRSEPSHGHHVSVGDTVVLYGQE